MLWPLTSGLFLLLAGCTNLDPKTVAVDRFDYSTAILDADNMIQSFPVLARVRKEPGEKIELSNESYSDTW